MAVRDTTSSAARWGPFDSQSTGQQPPPLAPAVYGVASSESAAAVTPSAPADIQDRVARPGRRRSRASRKAPVTLLNTDTTNFRAMVQQFTGFPSASSYQTPGFDPTFNVFPPTTVPPAVQVLQPQLYHHHQQQYQFPEATAFRIQDRSNINLQQSDAFLLHNNPQTSMEMADAFLFDRRG